MVRKASVLVAAAFAAVALAPFSASATGGQVYYETVGQNDTVFIPACQPGPDNPTCDPRGAGSRFISDGTLSLTQGGASVGSVHTDCSTTGKTGDDYYAVCTDTLKVGSSTVTAVGYLNESAMERFVPQVIPVAAPGGGSLTIQQIVYPNVFKLTLN